MYITVYLAYKQQYRFLFIVKQKVHLFGISNFTTVLKDYFNTIIVFL